METAIVISKDEVKKIIAKHFGVDEKNVIPSQYSFIVKGITGAQMETLKQLT